MSAPMTLKLKTKDRRDYGRIGRRKRPGVTDICDLFGDGTDGLVYWGARIGAECAYDDCLAGGSRDEVTARAARAHIKVRDEAAGIGILAHALVEIFLRTGVEPVPGFFDEPDDEHMRRARVAFRKFHAWWTGEGQRTYELLDVEMPLIDEEMGYGGTLDLLLRRRRDGATILGDLKTGKALYGKTVVQLGGYAGLLARKRSIRVDEAIVIHAPVTERELSVALVSRKQLEAGAAAFSALLLFVHGNRQHFTLETTISDDTEGAQS